MQNARDESLAAHDVNQAGVSSTPNVLPGASAMIAEPSAAASTDPMSTAILAMAASPLPGKAWSAINNATVSPIPHRQMAPMKVPMPMPFGARAISVFTAASE